MAEQANRRAPGYAWLMGPVAVGLGVGAHLVSGGQAPAPLIAVAVAALISLAASMLAPFLGSGWFLMVFSGVCQQLLHLAFSVVAAPPGGRLGHGHDGGAEQLPGAPSAVVAAHSGDLMVYTHVAAALLTALVLSKTGTYLRSLQHARRKEHPDATPEMGRRLT